MEVLAVTGLVLAMLIVLIGVVAFIVGQID